MLRGSYEAFNTRTLPIDVAEKIGFTDSNIGGTEKGCNTADEG
jgi:hypothetical protein